MFKRNKFGLEVRGAAVNATQFRLSRLAFELRFGFEHGCSICEAPGSNQTHRTAGSGVGRASTRVVLRYAAMQISRDAGVQ